MVRHEDWLLAGFVALASPLFAIIEGVAGPFDSGRPLDGIVRLAGVCGALACLATRNSDRPEPAEPIMASATAGPIIGVLALAGATSFAGLSLLPPLGFGIVFAAGIMIAVSQGHRPAVPVAVRRALLVPFLMAAGGILWSLVESVAGATDVAGQLGRAPAAFGLGLGVLAVLSGAYYAMLVYAPRQIVEREGDLRTWLIRYALFVAGVAFGLSWFAALV
ncbi:MAG: hypothetical protein ABSE70_11550 [Candidatus Limnocylindrales bacterium]